MVTALRVEQGQVIAEGQSLMTLAGDGEREIVADIPEEWVGRVRTATASATGWTASQPKAVLPLRLRELSPLATAQGRTFRARFAATSDSRDALAKLLLGSTTQLQLESREAGDRGMVIPVSALVKGSGPAGVWKVNSGVNGLIFTPVQVIGIDDTSLRVSGLTVGQRVVSVGAQKLDGKLIVRAIDRPGDELNPVVTSPVVPRIGS